MRKLLVTAAAIALVTCVPASAGGGVEAKLTIGNVFENNGSVAVSGKLKSSNNACATLRDVVLFDARGNDRLGKTRARDGRWVVETGKVDVGDRIYAKAKRKTVGSGDNRVLCAKAKSRVFKVKRIVDHD